MDNKIVMLKFLEVMRSTVSEGNCENKWKKVVSWGTINKKINRNPSIHKLRNYFFSISQRKS